jgi:acyl carrier protein
LNVREIVQTKLAAIVAENSPVPFPASIDDDELLDAFGLDSAAFVTLLAELEEEVGHIPAAILQGDYYPETFGELVTAFTK